jgi:hypothetical protein
MFAALHPGYQALAPRNDGGHSPHFERKARSSGGSMIPNSGNRLSDKIMLNKKADGFVRKSTS